MIYLDYAATSGRKPESVYEAADDALRNASGNPGRSGHKLSLEAGRLVLETRMKLAKLFHAETAESIVFCLNCTDALNLALWGTLKPGDHVIASHMEHNSVARPLEHMKDKGSLVSKMPTSIENGVDPKDVEAAITPATKLVVMSHMSNVTGTINDIEAIGEVCLRHGITFLVDAAQSAGVLPIDVQAMHIDMLAFPGHKGLYGPQGTGGLYISPDIDLDPVRQGGTGTKSEMLHQPEDRPEKYESGTVNVPGIAALGAGVQFLLDTGVEKVAEKEDALIRQLHDGLKEISGVHIIGPEEKRGPVLSFTVDGFDPQEVSIMLDQVFEIATRSGLHCAPDVHETAGTLETGGTVRVSPGYFTTEEEIEKCVEAVGLIAAGEI